MKSLLQTGASLLLKVQYEDGEEKIIGFCSDLSYTVTQGQKLIYTVDQVTPVEIAQGAGPSQVSGTMNLYLPKGVTMESAGLVPARHDRKGLPAMGLSKAMKVKIYDRSSSALIVALEGVKVGQYTVSVPSRGIVKIQLSFNGMAATPGNAL
jgi:hypothetical protein